MKGGVATLWRVEKERKSRWRRRSRDKKRTRKINWGNYTHRVNDNIKNLIKKRETISEKIHAIINFTDDPEIFLHLVQRLIVYLLHVIKVGTSSTKVLSKVDTIIVILARSFEKFRVEYTNNENTNNEKNRNRSTNDVYDYLNEQVAYIGDVIRSNNEMQQGMLAEELRYALTDALQEIIARKDNNLEDLATVFAGVGL